MKSAKLAILALLAVSLTAGTVPAYGFAEVPAPVPAVDPTVESDPGGILLPSQTGEAGVTDPVVPEYPVSEPSPATVPGEELPALPGADHDQAHPEHNEVDGEHNEATVETDTDESGEDLGYDPVVGGGFPVPGPDTPMVTDPDGTVRSAVETDISAAHDHGAQTFSTRDGGASTSAAAARSGTIQVTIVYATLTDNRGAVDQTAARNSVTAANNYWRSMSGGRLGFSIANSRSINSSATSWQDYADMMNTIKRDLGWRDSANTALLVYVPAADLKSGGYGGILGGGWTSGPTSGSVLMPRPSGFTNNVVTHEFGHVLGLLHANSLKCDNGRADVGGSGKAWNDASCTSREYGDTSDLMGYAQYSLPTINSYFWDQGSFGSGNEIFNAGRVRGSASFTLRPWAGSQDYRAVKFEDANSGEVYYLELRLPVGYDSSTAVGGNRGVKVVKADRANDWATNSVVLAPNTRNFSGYTNANSTWQQGQTFRTHTGVTVKVNWISGDAASVTINGPALEDWTQRVFSPGDFNGDGVGDLLTRRSNGTLWLSNGKGDGTFGPAAWIGSGFQVFDRFISTGDYDGDGKNDFLARHTDGSLWRYSGTGAVHAGEEGYRNRGKIGEYGWDSFDSLLGVGDADGDGRNDIVARSPNGTAHLYSGTGTGQHGPSRSIGTGWNQYNGLVGTRDFNGDGRVDILARTADGRIWLLQGNGRGSFTQGASIGEGWNSYWDIFGGVDFNRDGKPDLIGYRNHTAALVFYPGTGRVSEGYGAPVQTQGLSVTTAATVVDAGDFNGDKGTDLLSIGKDGKLWLHPGVRAEPGRYEGARWIGTGWGIYVDVIASDYNQDGKPDLIARRSDGTLWFYRGTGQVGNGNEGYGAAERIGTGWDIFTEILAPGDLNSDGRADILARHTNGSLWFYAGLGNTGGGREGFRAGSIIGKSGWDAFTSLTAAGDYDRNGTNDLLARYPDGRLMLYRGSGNSSFRAAELVGSGWDAFTMLVGPGDKAESVRHGYTGITGGGSSVFYRSDGMGDEGYGSAKTVGGL